MNEYVKLFGKTLAIIVAAFFLQSVVHPFVLVGGDEGRYAQDAVRVLSGEWPIADFTTRTPILLWLMGLSVQCFGMSLFVLRLPGLLASACTAGTAFHIGRRMGNERIGWWAAILYTTLPFTLWQNAVIKSESLTVLFTAIAAFGLLSYRDTKKWKHLFYAGIFSGLALVERLSAIAFVFSFVVFLSVVLWDRAQVYASVMRVLRAGVWYALGCCVGWGGVVGMLLARNMQPVITFYFSPFLLNAVTESRGYVFVWQEFVRSWALVFVETLASQAGVVFWGALAGTLMIALHWGDVRKKAAVVGIVGVLVVFFLFHTATIFYYGTFHVDVFMWVFAGAVAFGGASMLYARRALFFPVSPNSNFPLYWIGGHVCAYSFFVPGYPRELILPMTLLTAIFCAHVTWQGVARVIALIGACCLFVGGLLWYQNPRVGGWWWSQKTMNDVAIYIRERTASGDRVFAANPLPAVLAGRRTVLDMNPYAIKLASNAEASWGSFASPSRYYQELVARPPMYAIVDGRMEGQYFSAYPMFEDFLKKNYHPVQTFWTGERRGKVVIWENNAR